MRRGPAVCATAVALALINVGLASLIVAAAGTPGLAPVWLAVVLLALGIACAALAIALWRQYLVDARRR